MSRILYLHIGVGRTGSSVLQVAFARNVDLFRAHGINYWETPAVERARRGAVTSGNGTTLFAYLFPEHNKGKRKWDAEAVPPVIDSYFGQESTAFASSELFGFMPPVVWGRLIRCAADTEIRVIVFVRDVVSSFLSAYSHHVNWGRFSGTFSDYLRSRNANKYSSALALRWAGRILGVEAFTVLHYETERDRLFQAVCHALGFDVPAQPRQVLNASSGAHAVSPEDLELMQRKFTDDVAWINETFFGGTRVVSVLGKEHLAAETP